MGGLSEVVQDAEQWQGSRSSRSLCGPEALSQAPRSESASDRRALVGAAVSDRAAEPQASGGDEGRVRRSRERAVGDAPWRSGRGRVRLPDEAVR